MTQGYTTSDSTGRPNLPYAGMKKKWQHHFAHGKWLHLGMALSQVQEELWLVCQRREIDLDRASSTSAPGVILYFITLITSGSQEIISRVLSEYETGPTSFKGRRDDPTPLVRSTPLF